jgi:two-component system, OmpR family, response regulator
VSEIAAGSILIVDDDDGFRHAVRSALEFAGFDVSEAASGRDALASADRSRPSLVVLDVLLPELSGYGVCQELRKQHGRHLPVLFISGERTEPADRAAGLMLGGDDYLVKPVDPEELVARVRALLRRRNGGQVQGSGGLTKRELEILRLLAGGHQQREIASALVISPKTVATHIERIMGKLRVHSRAQAVAAAYRHGLVEV